MFFDLITIIKDPIALREFLLVKLINGEKATFQTPTFSRKRERTLEMLIKDLYEECVHDTKMVSYSLSPNAIYSWTFFDFYLLFL